MPQNENVINRYYEELRERSRHILEGQGTSLPDITLEDAVDFVCSEQIHFDSVPVALFKGSSEDMLTHRDVSLLYLISNREKMFADECITFNELQISEELAFYYGVQRSKGKKKNSIQKYLTIKKLNPKQNQGHEININCSKFCARARLVLAFKSAALNSGASQKQDSLHWVASQIDPSGNFSLEDYWFYEQHTGVNLAVEIAALLDELYQKYIKVSGVRQNWNIIINVICKCIEENYGYIACVPAIDWKINVMKIACTTIVEELVSALQGKTKTKLKPLAAEIYQAKLFPKYSWASIFNEKVQVIRFFKPLFEQKISNAFNQIICLFILDKLQTDTIFSGRSILSDAFRWVRPEYANIQSSGTDTGTIWAFKGIPGVPHMYRSQDRDQLEIQSKWYEFRALQGFSSIPEMLPLSQGKYIKIPEFEAIIRRSYEDLSNKNTLLIFCDHSNLFVKPYLKTLSGICKKYSRLRAVKEQNSMLKIAKELASENVSRAKMNNQFILIQKAVRIAIESGEQVNKP